MPYCSVNEAWGRDFGSQIQEKKQTFPVNENLSQDHQSIESEYPLLSKHLAKQTERNIEQLDQNPASFSDPYDSDDENLLEEEDYQDLFNGEPLVNANVKHTKHKKETHRQYEEGTSRFLEAPPSHKAILKQSSEKNKVIHTRRELDSQVEEYLNLLNRKIKRLEDNLQKTSSFTSSSKPFYKNIFFYLLVIAILCLIVDIGIRILFHYKQKVPTFTSQYSSSPMTSSTPMTTTPMTNTSSSMMYGGGREKIPKYFMQSSMGPRFHPHYYHSGFHYT